MQCHATFMPAIAHLVWPRSTKGLGLMLSTLDRELSGEEGGGAEGPLRVSSRGRGCSDVGLAAAGLHLAVELLRASLLLEGGFCCSPCCPQPPKSSRSSHVSGPQPSTCDCKGSEETVPSPGT